MSVIKNKLNESNELILEIRNKMREEMNEQISLISQIKDYSAFFTSDPNKDFSAETQRLITENAELRAQNADLDDENEVLRNRIAELEAQLL